MSRIVFKRIIGIFLTVTVLLGVFMSVYAGSGAIELDEESRETLENVTQILFILGAAVCIGKVIQIGIMYVTSSAVDKSNAKMAIIPWLIGTFVCFGAATIGKFIISLLGSDMNGNVLDY